LAAINGENTSKINVNFQEKMRAKAKEMVIVEIFKNITDIKLVRALCN
jgi:hypothetical protein